MNAYYISTPIQLFSFQKKGEYEPQLGDYLGEFTNEIDPKEGNYIKEFVSAGPKNYGYKLDTNKSHALVNGFAINHLTCFPICSYNFPIFSYKDTCFPIFSYIFLIFSYILCFF